MAAVPVTLSGVMFPKGKAGGDKPVPCTIVAYAWATGLSVGGGPMPGGGASGAHPEHPMVPPGGYPHPEHPIVLPPEQPVPPDIPSDPSVVKPPPPEGGWGWSPAYGWGYFPGSGGAGPKK